MASTRKVGILFALFSCLLSVRLVSGVEFEVGGKDGWAIPYKDAQLYNRWASKNRFLVNDTVHFKYQKDSVLEVSNGDYNKCKSSHPLLFFNNGDTVIRLDRPGFFYFISGVSGHCNKGLKMIVKVREPEFNATLAPSPKKNGAMQMGGVVSSITLTGFMAMSFLGALFA